MGSYKHCKERKEMITTGTAGNFSTGKKNQGLILCFKNVKQERDEEHE